MIASLCGTLLEKSGASLVLEVAGVGYEMGVSQTTLNVLPKIGTPSVLLYCRLRPTEQVISLYGFATKEERAVFDKLVTVSGVGPKVALAILSNFTPLELAEIIALQDEKRMQSVSGVGKKMAGRLLLELKGLFATDEEFQKLTGLAGVSFSVSPLSSNKDDSSLATILAEATEALLGLGYAPKEVEVALQIAAKEYLAANEHDAAQKTGPARGNIPAHKRVDAQRQSSQQERVVVDQGALDGNEEPLTVEQLLKQALIILGGGRHVGS